VPDVDKNSRTAKKKECAGGGEDAQLQFPKNNINNFIILYKYIISFLSPGRE